MDVSELCAFFEIVNLDHHVPILCLRSSLEATLKDWSKKVGGRLDYLNNVLCCCFYSPLPLPSSTPPPLSPLYLHLEPNLTIGIRRTTNRVIIIIVPVQCTGNSGCFPLGKASSHSTALPSFFWLLFSLCAVCSCLHTTGCEPYNAREIWAAFLNESKQP